MASEIKVDDIKDVAGAFTQARLIDVSFVLDGAVSTGTTAMFLDDTIPQNTEGDQYMSLVHTPKNAANILKIEVQWNGASNVGNGITIGLFQDALVDAIAAIEAIVVAANIYRSQSLIFYMVAGTTSAITFNVRAGGSSGTTTFNGNSSLRRYGGVGFSSISVMEIKPD